MAIQITMPRLSDTMQEGTLNRWHVKVGDVIKSGDTLADVETDKATMELQAFDDGTVAHLAVEPGQTVAVGALILVLAEKGESPSSITPPTPQLSPPLSPATATSSTASSKSAAASAPVSFPPLTPPTAATFTGGAAKPATASAEAKPSSPASPVASQAQEDESARMKITPVARKLASHLNVNPTQLQGTGPGGRIIKRDILAASNLIPAQAASTPVAAASSATTQTQSTTPAPVLQLPQTPHDSNALANSKLPIAAIVSASMQSQTQPLTNMRKTIARRLVESKTTIPHFTVSTRMDMDALLALRQTLNEQLGSQNIKLSVNDFLIRACALACLANPLVNSSWSEQGILIHGTVNIGVAVSLPADKGGGLVVPVLRDVQTKGLRTISQETKALADKARTKGLSPDDMAGGTFTISNLGMFGVDHFEAIINPPQSAILAVGAALPKPMVRENQVVIGHEMSATISADHRTIDGAIAAQFLASLKQLLESPASLLV